MVAVVQTLREQVAWACRILALEGYADLTLGHVSARGPDGEIWISSATLASLRAPSALPPIEPLPPARVKGREAPVEVHRVRWDLPG